MGLKYKQSTLDAQIRGLTRASAEFKGMIADEMESIVPAVEASMIFNSDMHKNRITSDMVNAMHAEVARTKTTLRFGFLREIKDYFRYQTITGFTHWKSGAFIAPSLALSDAKEDAKVLMDEAAKRIRRNFMARLRRRG